MLSRFSSLFVYVVAGLVISAAATPTGPPSEYDDGSKSPSYPAHPVQKYPQNEAVKSYSEEKPYPKSYQEEKYPQAHERPPYRKSNERYKSLAANKAVSYNEQSCNVGKQQCCNTVYENNDDDDENPYGKRDVITDILTFLKGLTSLDLSGLGLEGDLQNTSGPVGVNCSPMNDSSGGAGNCTASPMCCNNNRFGGLIVFGCQSPLDIST
ncbi:hypothetical protein BC827DRAFT_1269103 [Russula dissimulans]|nr:hypothetical protein BC827DRAFT_1269103 [Russula dissimulans]